MLEMLRGQSWSLGELANRHRVTPSTMSRSVDLLVRREWVTRRSDPLDRRQVILALSDEGRAAHTMLVNQVHETISDLLTKLDADDLQKLYDGVLVLRKLIDQQRDVKC
jgi:DNA-binding MarR family transcriptional regulator